MTPFDEKVREIIRRHLDRLEDDLMEIYEKCKPASSTLTNEAWDQWTKEYSPSVNPQPPVKK